MLTGYWQSLPIVVMREGSGKGCRHYRQSGPDRFEKLPTDPVTAGRHHHYMRDGTLHSARIGVLEELAHKVLWLACWMIHHANHIRPNRDGVKVGGHQASSASLVTLMTALYLDVLRPQDRIAVKPHASPVYHAIQYLLGKQTREKLERFRAFGGAQSSPLESNVSASPEIPWIFTAPTGSTQKPSSMRWPWRLLKSAKLAANS